MKQPCDRDCINRCPGCGASCPDWAKYVQWRNKEYERRKAICKQAEAISDGFRRCGANVNMK